MFFLSYHLKQINYTKLNTVFVPDMGAERCLGPEKMGPSWGRGVRGEGPAPQEARKIAVSAQRGRRQHGEGRRRKDKLGVMKEDQSKQS
jgi:hypothetical protein